MATPEPDTQLDAEYRALIRSLHEDTIKAVVAVQNWWEPDVNRITVLGGYAGEKEELLAKTLEHKWRTKVHPRLLTLSQGHPDPDVRFAADILDKRLWSAVRLLGESRRGDGIEPADHDVTSVTVHLIYDGFARLKKATYHAPFRIHRPVPDFDGFSVGNREPLPGRMLDTIRELQEAGVLDKGSGLPDFSMSDAVRRLSDIMFMSDEDRTQLFADADVEDPTLSDPVDAAGSSGPGFGFTFPNYASD